MLTENDRADLVEDIQRATAGMTDAQKRHVLECWEFMAAELARVLGASQSESELRQPPPWGSKISQPGGQG